MKMTTLVNLADTVCRLNRETSAAAHIEQRPVSILIGRTKSVTFVGGEKVAPSAKYPSREQYLARLQVEATIGADHLTLDPDLTMGDCQAAFTF